MSDADQTIKFELIFQTDQAVKKIQIATQIVNDLKKDLTTLAEATKTAGVPIDQLGTCYFALF